MRCHLRATFHKSRCARVGDVSRWIVSSNSSAKSYILGNRRLLNACDAFFLCIDAVELCTNLYPQTLHYYRPMSKTTLFTYVGSELEVFAHAHRWRAYWKAQILPYIGKNVLEVGAGIGSATRLLCNPAIGRWVAMEPDLAMCKILLQMTEGGELGKNCLIRNGTTRSLNPIESFDTILYIDV